MFFVKENSWIARIAAWKLSSRQVAIVIGRTIHLYNTSEAEFLKNERWLRHELCHIDQFRRFGFTRFILLYLWESLRKGYRHNKYEVEARQAETSSLRSPIPPRQNRTAAPWYQK